MSHLFKHDTYETNRIRPLRAYVERQVAHLKHLHPEDSEESIRTFVEQLVMDKLKTTPQPRIEILDHPTPGVTKRKWVGLTEYTHAGIAQNIIAPSGSVYCTPDKRESPIKAVLREKVGERGTYKKVMLKALERGDQVEADIANFQQASAKIFNNSIPGAMGSEYNSLYDLPGYNAVTSISRQSVRAGYAHMEKMVEGNLFLRSADDVIDYCSIHLRIIPADAEQVLTKYKMYIPTPTDMYTFFERSLRYYIMGVAKLRPRLMRYFETMSPTQRAFVFYANNLHNLTRFNDQLVRSHMDDLFRTDNLVIDPDVDPKKIKGFEKDLMMMNTSINSKFIDNLSIQDALDEKHPGIPKMIAIAQHMEMVLQSHADFWSTFLRVDVDTGGLQFHPNMVRRCVLVSDTDSVIFSTQSMVEWYSRKVSFEETSYQVNAFTVYAAQRTLEHVFARLSCGFGMIGDDIKMISMKNEFLYPIFIRTPIGKHYAGISTQQEGKILKFPKMDIKGLQFRSSKLSDITNKTTNDFLVWIMKTVMKDLEISGREALAKVAQFEQDVYESLIRREKTFLEVESVKDISEYNTEEDAMKSTYLLYLFWEKVFADTFGPIVIPNKCPKIPLRGKNALTNPAWLAKAAEIDPRIPGRIAEFTKQYGRELSYIVIPPTFSTLPDILHDLLDIRSIIFRNASPLYLGLQSLGFGSNHDKQMLLVNDFFDVDGAVQIPF